MASTLSAVARFLAVVTSVTHALKAESLLVEPINVITQSITIITIAVAVTALRGSEIPKSAETLSFVIKPNAKVIIPQTT